MTVTTDQQDRLAKLQADRESNEGSKWKQKSHWWLRWAHVYLSMLSLLIVLFFGITGITLNHPDWTFGTEPSRITTDGVLPSGAVNGTDVEWLTVSEYLRNEHGVKGEVTNFTSDEVEGNISFKGPGYGAEVFFDIPGGEFSLSEQKQGWITVINDLHKGRDTKTSWRWVIDLSGVLLVFVGATGLGIQLFMRKRRVSALSWAVIGTVVAAAFIWYATI